MAPVQFENPADSLQRLPQLIQSIPDTLRNPAANPVQAAVLLGIVLVLLLILVVTVFLFVVRPTREEEELWEETLSDEELAAVDAATAHDRRRSLLTVASIAVLILVAVWITAGVTTSSRDVCSSCHTNTPHAVAKAEDPHLGVACVRCHESGGAVARVSVNLVGRVEHVLLARTNKKAASTFGTPPASDGCYGCHRKEITKTTLDPTLQVKMSHKEPLVAGAQCVDCHALKSGVVSRVTVGMSPCLRCHDGNRAKADCVECHVGDPSQAITPDIAPNAMASMQVRNPQCSGCHKDMSTCNACHGISMPHSDLFKAFGHARPAAEAIWSNNLQVCEKCHYTGHNSCRQYGCHIAAFPQHPSPDWRTIHASATWSGSAMTCGSCHEWNPNDHDGMNFCQVCHPVKPASAHK
jgi:hypothetical protein